MQKGKAAPDRRLIFKTNLNQRRSLNITAVDKISTPQCGHDRPVVRNVVEIDGPCAYICRECYNYLLRVEAKAVVRRQVAALFSASLPRIERSGALGEVSYG